jgi:putative transcriptional regulator
MTSRENKEKTNPRLTRELLEMAKDMHASGLMTDAAYEKITVRHVEDVSTTTPCSGAKT